MIVLEYLIVLGLILLGFRTRQYRFILFGIILALVFILINIF